MLDDAALAKQIDLLWLADGHLGRQDSIYRKQYSAAESEQRRFTDYGTGVQLGLTVARDVTDVIRQYKHKHHGEVVDIGIFRVGYERGRFLDAAAGIHYLTDPISKQSFDPVTDVGFFSDVHLLDNPFGIGARIKTVLGLAQVTDAQQATVQLTPTGLFIKPARVKTSVLPGEINPLPLGYVPGYTNPKLQMTHVPQVSLSADSYITPYLLDLNGLAPLERIPQHERYLRVPPSNRLR